jgi:eukaryotic-like serine/threonine-protein kinase
MDAATARPLIGRSIHNYVIKQKIGEGGMGVVYLGEHPKINRRVAIKVLLPQLSRDPGVVQRFFHEAKAATEIRNEHIVDIIDFGELDDGSHYIIMEWLDGRSLAEALAQDGRFGLVRSIHIARGIGRALGAAHSRGIVHRDLKPDNIFLIRHGDDPDFVKVLDFGIAKLMLADADIKTQTGAIMGTPFYMSPEQCNGSAVDQRTDVYALGVILYQMLAGRLPFNQTTLGELLIAHLQQPPPPPSKFEPSIPATVERALLQALAKDPAQRFSNVDALVRAFADVITGVQPVVTAEPTPPRPLVSPSAPTVPPPTRSKPLGRTIANTAAEVFVRIGVRGRRAQAIVAGAAGLVLLLLVVIVVLASRSAAPPPAPSPPSVVMTPSGPETLPKEVVTNDREALVDKLHDARTCKERRAAALALIASNDKRYLESLRAARDRRGGGPFGFFEEPNRCMRRELDAAIRKLELR